MSPRLRLALVSTIVAAGLVLLGFGAAVLVLSTSQASGDAATTDASKFPPLIADSHNLLTVPEPIHYKAAGKATSVYSYGVDETTSHTVEGVTTGSIELTDNVLTQATIEITAEGYPSVSFELTESCFLGRGAATGDSAAIAYGIVTVDGVQQSTDLALNASFNDDTGIITGTITVPSDLLSSVQQVAGYSPEAVGSTGTVDFDLNAERLTN